MADKSIVVELDRIYRVLNDALFGSKLNIVPIAIQARKKVSLRWQADAETLILGSELCNIQNSELGGLLLHEMVHVYNHQRGIADVTTNQYHNKYFLQTALSVGLIVIKHKTQGWSITSTIYPRNVIEKAYIKRPNKEAWAARNKVFSSITLDQNAFKIAVRDIKDRNRVDKPTKTFFLKYQCNCPPPHNSIRSGRRPDGPNAPNVMCKDCRSDFVCVENYLD